MKLTDAKAFMVFDVESVGLHGEAFAFGFVVTQGDNELERGGAYCNPVLAKGTAESREWVAGNVPEVLLGERVAYPLSVRSCFWRAWRRWQERGALLFADCCWPVEARFLADCVDDDPAERSWTGPYPIHDVATVRLLAGFDPNATESRMTWEEPAHDPLCDALQSSRLLLEALDVLAKRE